MRYQLVIQVPFNSTADYDHLVTVENLLIENLPKGSQVDGHDAGSEQANIFIHTSSPVETFEAIRKLLRDQKFWDSARAAYRELSGNRYEILWPNDLEQFAIS